MIEKKESYRQGSFSAIEPFADLAIVDDEAKPFFAFAVPEFRGYEHAPRVSTNISKVETWLPYIYFKEGILNEPETREHSVEAEKASIIGQEMHRADVLFNLIIQGTVGPFVKRGLPTAKQEDLDIFGRATSDVTVPQGVDSEWMTALFHNSWSKLLQARQQQEREKIGTLPMFGDVNLPDPGDKSLAFRVLQSQELEQMGLLLAKHWVDKCFNGDVGYWGHSFDHQSLNETLVIVNLELLQLKSRFDRITRPEKVKKTLEVQVSDFKTGNKEVKNELDAEIRKRQAQLMLFMTEIFTSRHILDKKWLTHRGSGFAMNASMLDQASVGRARFFYRWFDKQTGEIERQEVTMNEPERKDFHDWLVWYSTKAQDYREELKKLRR